MGSLRKFRVLALFLIFCLLLQQPVPLQAKSYKGKYADISHLFKEPKTGDLAIGAAFTLLSCYIPAKLGNADYFVNFGKGAFTSSISQAAMNVAVDKWNFNPEAAQVFGHAVTGMANGVFGARDGLYSFGDNKFWNNHNAFRGAVMGTFKGAAIGGGNLLAYQALKGSGLYRNNPYIGNQVVSVLGGALGGGAFNLAARSSGFTVGDFYQPMMENLKTKAIGLGVQYAFSEAGVRPVYSKVLGDIAGGYKDIGNALLSSGISSGLEALAGDYDARGYNKFGLTSTAMAGVEWLASSLAHGAVTKDFASAFNRSFVNLGTWGGTIGNSGYNEVVFIQKIAEFGGYANFKASADRMMKQGGYSSWKKFVGDGKHSELFPSLSNSIVRNASAIMHQSAVENLTDLAGIGFGKLRTYAADKLKKDRPQEIKNIVNGFELPGKSRKSLFEQLGLKKGIVGKTENPLVYNKYQEDEMESLFTSSLDEMEQSFEEFGAVPEGVDPNSVSVFEETTTTGDPEAVREMNKRFDQLNEKSKKPFKVYNEPLEQLPAGFVFNMDKYNRVIDNAEGKTYIDEIDPATNVSIKRYVVEKNQRANYGFVEDEAGKLTFGDIPTATPQAPAQQVISTPQKPVSKCHLFEKIKPGHTFQVETPMGIKKAMVTGVSEDRNEDNDIVRVVYITAVDGSQYTYKGFPDAIFEGTTPSTVSGQIQHPSSATQAVLNRTVSAEALKDTFRPNAFGEVMGSASAPEGQPYNVSSIKNELVVMDHSTLSRLGPGTRVMVPFEGEDGTIKGVVEAERKKLRAPFDPKKYFALALVGEGAFEPFKKDGEVLVLPGYTVARPVKEVISVNPVSHEDVRSGKVKRLSFAQVPPQAPSEEIEFKIPAVISVGKDGSVTHIGEEQWTVKFDANGDQQLIPPENSQVPQSAADEIHPVELSRSYLNEVMTDKRNRDDAKYLVEDELRDFAKVVKAEFGNSAYEMMPKLLDEQGLQAYTYADKRIAPVPVAMPSIVAQESNVRYDGYTWTQDSFKPQSPAQQAPAPQKSVSIAKSTDSNISIYTPSEMPGVSPEALENAPKKRYEPKEVGVAFYGRYPRIYTDVKIERDEDNSNEKIVEFLYEGEVVKTMRAEKGWSDAEILDKYAEMRQRGEAIGGPHNWSLQGGHLNLIQNAVGGSDKNAVMEVLGRYNLEPHLTKSALPGRPFLEASTPNVVRNRKKEDNYKPIELYVVGDEYGNKIGYKYLDVSRVSPPQKPTQISQLQAAPEPLAPALEQKTVLPVQPLPAATHQLITATEDLKRAYYKAHSPSILKRALTNLNLGLVFNYDADEVAALEYEGTEPAFFTRKLGTEGTVSGWFLKKLGLKKEMASKLPFEMSRDEFIKAYTPSVGKRLLTNLNFGLLVNYDLNERIALELQYKKPVFWNNEWFAPEATTSLFREDYYLQTAKNYFNGSRFAQSVVAVVPQSPDPIKENVKVEVPAVASTAPDIRKEALKMAYYNTYKPSSLKRLLTNLNLGLVINYSPEETKALEMEGNKPVFFTGEWFAPGTFSGGIIGRSWSDYKAPFEMTREEFVKAYNPSLGKKLLTNLNLGLLVNYDLNERAALELQGKKPASFTGEWFAPGTFTGRLIGRGDAYVSAVKGYYNKPAKIAPKPIPIPEIKAPAEVHVPIVFSPVPSDISAEAGIDGMSMVDQDMSCDLMEADVSPAPVEDIKKPTKSLSRESLLDSLTANVKGRINKSGIPKDGVGAIVYEEAKKLDIITNPDDSKVNNKILWGDEYIKGQGGVARYVTKQLGIEEIVKKTASATKPSDVSKPEEASAPAQDSFVNLLDEMHKQEIEKAFADMGADNSGILDVMSKAFAMSPEEVNKKFKIKRAYESDGNTLLVEYIKESGDVWRVAIDKSRNKITKADSLGKASAPETTLRPLVPTAKPAMAVSEFDKEIETAKKQLNLYINSPAPATSQQEQGLQRFIGKPKKELITEGVVPALKNALGVFQDPDWVNDTIKNIGEIGNLLVIEQDVSRYAHHEGDDKSAIVTYNKKTGQASMHAIGSRSGLFDWYKLGDRLLIGERNKNGFGYDRTVVLSSDGTMERLEDGSYISMIDEYRRNLQTGEKKPAVVTQSSRPNVKIFTGKSMSALGAALSGVKDFEKQYGYKTLDKGKVEYIQQDPSSGVTTVEFSHNGNLRIATFDKEGKFVAASNIISKGRDYTDKQNVLNATVFKPKSWGFGHTGEQVVVNNNTGVIRHLSSVDNKKKAGVSNIVNSSVNVMQNDASSSHPNIGVLQSKIEKLNQDYHSLKQTDPEQANDAMTQSIKLQEQLSKIMSRNKR